MPETGRGRRWHRPALSAALLWPRPAHLRQAGPCSHLASPRCLIGSMWQRHLNGIFNNMIKNYADGWYWPVRLLTSSAPTMIKNSIKFDGLALQWLLFTDCELKVLYYYIISIHIFYCCSCYCAELVILFMFQMCEFWCDSYASYKYRIE